MHDSCLKIEVPFISVESITAISKLHIYLLINNIKCNVVYVLLIIMWWFFSSFSGKSETPKEYNTEVMDMLKEHAKNKEKEQRYIQPDLYETHN